MDKLLEYKRNWIQHVNRMPRNNLPRVMKHCSPPGRRNHGSPLRWLLDTWDRNRSTSGPTPWKIYGDDDDGHQYQVSWGKVQYCGRWKYWSLGDIIHMYMWLILNGYWDTDVWNWYLHRSCQVCWCWWWDFRAFIVNCNKFVIYIYQIFNLNSKLKLK